MYRVKQGIIGILVRKFRVLPFPFQLVFSSLHHGDVQNGIEITRKIHQVTQLVPLLSDVGKSHLRIRMKRRHFVRSVKSQVSCV